MHKSRIGAIFIDHPPSTFDASVAFWAAAMGRVPDEGREPHPPYTSLGRFEGELAVDLQRLDEEGPARLHLDVDTDDVEAEVRRLEALGATRVKQYDHYWQLAVSPKYRLTRDAWHPRCRHRDPRPYARHDLRTAAPAARHFRPAAPAARRAVLIWRLRRRGRALNRPYFGDTTWPTPAA